MQFLVRSNDSPCNFRRWMRLWGCAASEPEHASSNAFMAITKIMRQRLAEGTRVGSSPKTCLFPRKSTPYVLFFAGFVPALAKPHQPATDPSPRRDRITTSSTFATALSPTNLRASNVLNLSTRPASTEIWRIRVFLPLSFRTKIRNDRTTTMIRV